VGFRIRFRARRIALVAVAAGILALPASASAGTYQVEACRTAGGSAQSTLGWALSSITGIASTDGCAGGGSLRHVLNGLLNLGDRSSWHFDAPAGTKIAGYDLWRSASVGGLLGGLGMRYELDEVTGGTPTAVDFLNPPLLAGTSTLGNAGVPLDPSNLFSRSGLSADSITADLGCLLGACLLSSTGQMDLHRALVTLTDGAAPVFGTVTGALTSGAGGFAGTKALSFDATDAGGGLRHAILRADGTDVVTGLVSSNGGTCTSGTVFTAAVPCVLSATGSALSLDTTTLTDGNHALSLVLKDVAGNETTHSLGTALVDNTAPAGTLVRAAGDNSEVISFLLGDIGAPGVPTSGLDALSALAEYSSDGGATWHALLDPVLLTNAATGIKTLTGLIPSALSGQLKVRTRVADLAGNLFQSPPQTVTVDRGTGGGGTGGGSTSSPVTLIITQGGYQRLAFGKAGTVRGLLLDAAGAPLSGRTIAAFDGANVRTVVTDGAGRWSYQLAAGASRVAGFVFFRTGVAPVVAPARVVVKGAITAATRVGRAARNGSRAIRVTGVLRSRKDAKALPRVAIEVRRAGKWHRLRTVRPSRSTGRYTATGRIPRTVNAVRARTLSLSTYPYLAATSAVVKVKPVARRR
jgi:hypothetical protein